MISRAKRWSARVAHHSRALMLEERIFTRRDARTIAPPLERSAENSARRRNQLFRSAMSMLTFCIHRRRSWLGVDRRRAFERSMIELHDLFGRNAVSRHSTLAK